jgi:hypothetical protein
MQEQHRVALHPQASLVTYHLVTQNLKLKPQNCITPAQYAASKNASSKKYMDHSCG